MLVSRLKYTNPVFGDHVLVEFIIISIFIKNVPVRCRNWRGYSSNKLCNMLSNVDLNINIDDVQGYLNEFERLLIKIIDEIVPLVDFHGNIIKS